MIILNLVIGVCLLVEAPAQPPGAPPRGGLRLPEPAHGAGRACLRAARGHRHGRCLPHLAAGPVVALTVGPTRSSWSARPVRRRRTSRRWTAAPPGAGRGCAGDGPHGLRHGAAARWLSARAPGGDRPAGGAALAHEMAALLDDGLGRLGAPPALAGYHRRHRVPARVHRLGARRRGPSDAAGRRPIATGRWSPPWG
ncbi:hypothetical protein QJS66_21930 [Kocuria rhizophila]|nr:hypothetical protein QJS66_21930 [Kocuria rhizophila]